MEKYKICPNCGTKNPTDALECEECEEDLTAVKITDNEQQRKEEEAERSKSTSLDVVSWVRICDSCGAKNPANARKCSACGEDISDITPVADTEKPEEVEKSPSFVLTTVDGSYAYEITDEEITLGKEHEMSEYLITRPYVSRIHCKLYMVNQKLYIENLSRTNGTFVNGIRVTEVTELTDGDEIGLGGHEMNGRRDERAAYFTLGSR